MMGYIACSQASVYRCPGQKTLVRFTLVTNVMTDLTRSKTELILEYAFLPAVDHP
jgi:hypothetical protein